MPCEKRTVYHGLTLIGVIDLDRLVGIYKAQFPGAHVRNLEIPVSSTQGKRRIWRKIGYFIAPERGNREFSVFAKKP